MRLDIPTSSLGIGPVSRLSLSRLANESPQRKAFSICHTNKIRESREISFGTKVVLNIRPMINNNLSKATLKAHIMV